MGAYQYVAVDPLGKEHKGVMEGDTPRQVRGLLRERDLIPVEVTEIEGKRAVRRERLALGKGLSALDLALMTRQLATLARAGLPLEEALQAVAEQSEKARMKSTLLGVRAKVLEGHTLAAGLEEFPSTFPIVYRATIAAGEQAGRLDTVLERLADYTEARHSLRQKISHALIYPDRPDLSRDYDHHADARLCRPEGRRCIRVDGADTACPNACVDCPIRISAELVVAVAHRSGPGDIYDQPSIAPRGPEARGPSLAAPATADRPGHAGA